MPDTLQLNYGNPDTQEAMTCELVKIAGQCDGVRCDMAMLTLGQTPNEDANDYVLSNYFSPYSGIAD